MISPPRFSLADADRAYDEWGANCGPAALAAITGKTLDEVRPHLEGFDAKRYTNPTMMFAALRSLGVPHRSRPHYAPMPWPAFGLARIQWEGPWTRPGVPMRARYGCTHWVGSARNGAGVFDVNCLNNGSGWVARGDWEQLVVPAIVETYPRADGKWHLTHAIEVTL